MKHEKCATHKKVQHEQGTTFTTCRVQRKISTRKECNMKKCNTNKVQHGMSATQKKCDMKRVQHEATREKLQHEKSATVKYAQKSTQE